MTRPVLAIARQSQGTKVKSRGAESNIPGGYYCLVKAGSYFPRTSCSNLISHKDMIMSDKRSKRIRTTLQMEGLGLLSPKENAVKAHSLCRPGTERDRDKKKSLFAKRHGQNNLLSTRSLNTI